MAGDSRVAGRPGSGTGPSGQYASIARYERFRLLRGRYRRAALAVATVFLGWYSVYVGLSAFARDFMGRTVVGHVNVALLLGVLAGRLDFRGGLGVRGVRAAAARSAGR